MSNFYLIVKKIVHVLSYFAYVIIILYLLLCLPSLFGYVPSIVMSGSMEPSLKIGSVTYYKKVPKEQIFAKDVITFRSSEGLLVTHRIYTINGDDYITKGDANNTTDGERVSYDQVLGKNANTVVPYLGYLLYILRRNIFAPLLLVAILIFEYLFNTLKFSKRRTTRKRTTKKEEEEEKKPTRKKSTSKTSSSRKSTTTRKTTTTREKTTNKK